MSAYAENRKTILVSLPNPEIDNLLQQQSIRQISKEKEKKPQFKHKCWWKELATEEESHEFQKEPSGKLFVRNASSA